MDGSQFTQFHLALLLLAMVVGALLARAAQRRWHRRRMRRRFARGRLGEQEAVRLLEKAGYQILEDQLSRETGFWVDDQWCPITVRADFLVEKAGQTYVAEVKTGKSAPNPASTATRRQLLEYSHVYDADGLLLVDMEARQLRAIRFETRAVSQTADRAETRPWFYLLVGGAAGAAAALFLAGL